MGFWDRLLGREQSAPNEPQGYARYSRREAQPASARSDDEIAVERYRYLLRTAPPETIEQVHAEAFETLSPEQRRLVFQHLSENAPAGEAPRGDDAGSLAQAATRAEIRQPGTLERSLGGGGRQGGGMSFGGMVGSSLLGTVAGYVIGSALVGAFLPDPGAGEAGSDAGGSEDAGSDASGGESVEASGSDAGGDAGADFGSFGDFGGGDFGGGDFGGDF